MMTPSESNRVADALLPLFRAAMGRVETRDAGDVVGLYLQGTLFGIIQDGVLLFRVDGRTRADYDAAERWDDPDEAPEDDASGASFEAPGNAGLASASFRRLPPFVLDDEDTLADWARKAWEAGKRARAGQIT